MDCKSRILSIMDICIGDCEAFNESDADCFIDYHNKIKVAVKSKGTPGIEPATSRSAVECSTPELYPRRPSLTIIRI